jgi:hypothetical protein
MGGLLAILAIPGYWGRMGPSEMELEESFELRVLALLDQNPAEGRDMSEAG